MWSTRRGTQLKEAISGSLKGQVWDCVLQWLPWDVWGLGQSRCSTPEAWRQD